MTIQTLLGRTAFFKELRALRTERAEALQAIGSRNKEMQAEGYLALSERYYHAATVGTCKLTRVPLWQLWWQAPLWAVTWLPLNLWCFYRMLPLSDRAANVITYEQMTADECLVRHSILLLRRQYEEAGFAARFGLQKEALPAHVRASFLLGFAEAQRHLGYAEEAREALVTLLAEIRTIDQEGPHQAARIYRKAAKLIERIEMPRDTIEPSQLRALAELRASQAA